MTKRYFEFSEGTSNKFWEVWMEGTEVRTRYGKIGTSGQITVKDEGSAEKTQKLYDKLVREKTGKGYQEKTAAGSGATPAAAAAAPKPVADYQAEWKNLEAASNLPQALEAHFAFLCDTAACKPVLKKLCATATSVKADAKLLRVVFESPEGSDSEGEEWTLEASPPFTGTFEDNVPATHRRFCEHHNGVSLEGSDIPLSFNGVTEEGAIAGGGFESDYLEDADPELAEQFEEKGLPIVDPIGHHQDFVIYNFLKKTKLKEPALQFMSHEGGGLEAPYDVSLGITGNFLRLLVADVLGDADDAGDDDEGGGEGGARRFEFEEGGSSKFWEIRVEGSSHTVRYGKIGTDGQEKTKDFDDDDAAAADAAKLISEKTKKGYVEKS